MWRASLTFLLKGCNSVSRTVFNSSFSQPTSELFSLLMKAE
jgi:hypothetical protein